VTPRRGVSGLAAVAWLPLAISAICACSSGQPGASVASLPSHSAQPATTLTQSQQFQRLVRFAQCMRGRGIDVPDPVPGRFRIPVATDPSTAAAMQACQQWLPTLTTWCPIRLLGRSGRLRRVGPGNVSGRAERS